MSTKAFILGAAGVASLTFLANRPAEAMTTVLSHTFSYSTAIIGGNSGSLIPPGAMSAAFGPVHFDGISSVEIEWTYTESFSGNIGDTGGGITFSFGGDASVDGNNYDGSGNGNGSSGPSATLLRLSTGPTTMDDTFPNVDANPAIYSALIGPSPYTLEWGISGDSFSSSGSTSGTLSGVGEVQVIYTYAAAPEPATWALFLVGFAGVGALARSRPRSRLSMTP
jgi:hypothetical protein